MPRECEVVPAYRASFLRLRLIHEVIRLVISEDKGSEHSQDIQEIRGIDEISVLGDLVAERPEAGRLGEESFAERFGIRVFEDVV